MSKKTLNNSWQLNNFIKKFNSNNYIKTINKNIFETITNTCRIFLNTLEQLKRKLVAFLDLYIQNCTKVLGAPKDFLFIIAFRRDKTSLNI